MFDLKGRQCLNRVSLTYRFSVLAYVHKQIVRVFAIAVFENESESVKPRVCGYAYVAKYKVKISEVVGIRVAFFGKSGFEEPVANFG